ncbi:MAG: FUSC family protein [Gammaproteobacteria bacterium]|nr:MAG: FUSC family protein [Gammaproteobacteria bacterium]UTW42538.1 FUSC family protein [bacterium SCSIO 12844]
MKNLIRFDKLRQLCCILLPSASIAFITHQDFWLLAAFYAVCSIIPYSEHKNLKFALLMLVGLFLATEVLSYLIIQYPLIFIISLVIIGFIISVIEKNKPSYRPISAYLFIGLIYSSFEINHYFIHRSLDVISLIFLLSLTSLFLGILFETHHTQKLAISFKLKKTDSLDYLAYPTVLMITLVLWYLFNIPQPQWFIWSALTVTSLNIDQTHQKLIKRLKGASIGLPLGIISIFIIQLLCAPYSHLLQLIHYLSFMGIILSLRAFKHYIHGFAVRCFFISLFASDYFISISLNRICDVLLGGLIGYSLSYSLNHLKLLQKHIY